MSTPYTPSPTYHNPIRVTVDGDLADAGEFNTPYEQLADNAEFLKQRTQWIEDGGVVTPTNAITFACSFFPDAVVCANDSRTLGNQRVDGTTHLVGAVTCDSSLTVQSLTVVSAQTVAGTQTVVGTATFETDAIVEGNATVDGSLTVAGNATLGNSDSDQVILKGTSTAQAPMLFSATGRVTWPVVLGADGPVTYPSTSQHIFWGDTTLTGAFVQGLADNGISGDHILLTYRGSQTLTFNFPTPGNLVSLGVPAGKQWALCVNVGGTWRLAASGT